MQHTPCPDRRPSGFALLAILLLVAALTMMVGLSLQTGEDSRRVAAQIHHEQLATSLAEAGLERTRSYLLAILETDLDLDRALDPELDTDCTTRLDSGGTDTDYVPTFGDLTGPTSFTGVVQYPPGSDVYYRFIYMGQSEGGYVVRIDDNEDDALPDSVAASPSAPGCAEGGARHLPFRDRDKSVIITSIGFHPLNLGDPSVTPPTVAQVEAALAAARARRVLRARLTPSTSIGAGLIVGGDMDLSGNSRVCGDYGSVLGSRNLTAGDGNDEVCGTNCSTGATSCTIRAGGSCTLDGAPCLGSQSDIPQAPQVHVWSSQNAPTACTPAMGDNCIPFFYLRHAKPPRSTQETVELYMWNYALAPQCERPNTRPIIYPPKYVPPPPPPPPAPPPPPLVDCWQLVMDTRRDIMCTGDDKAIYFVDSNKLGRRDPRTLTRSTTSTDQLFPDPTASPLACAPSTPHISGYYIFKMTGGGDFPPGPAGCSSSTTAAAAAPYPNDAVDGSLHRGNLNTTNFEYEHGIRIPRGVWFIEGNVVLKSNSPACATLPFPDYGVSLIMTGDLKLTHEVHFDPIHPRGFTLLVGRDMDMDTGNTSFGTCGRSGAIMVHEQLRMKGNSRLFAQVVVESAASCSDTLSANEMQGTTEINVPWPPPISSGPASVPSLRSWSESSL